MGGLIFGVDLVIRRGWGVNNPLHSITLQKLIQTNILEPVKIFGNGFFLHNLILTLLSEKKNAKE